MNVLIVGTGYVGLVVGACLAETGNDVVCADIDAAKIAGLQEGVLPIYEPGLEELVRRNQAQGRLQFTTNAGAATARAAVAFLAVGTPPGEDGSADLRHVLEAAETVGRHVAQELVVVTKSTVPVGTAARVRDVIAAHATYPVHVCSNPEFLKEGAAVEDFLRPDRVVLGAESDHARSVLAELYAPFVRTGRPILFMDVASAELTKYAANAMLATRISFMNEIALLCERVGADVDQVRRGVGSDERIGPAFLFPGPGYGGSCFPKDVRALLHTAADFGVALNVTAGAERTNARQRTVVFERLRDVLGDFRGTRVAVWGLTFKPQTDDLRESPALALVDQLLEAGAEVSAHDPVAVPGARARYGDRVRFAESGYAALEGADALAVMTDWNEYRNPDFRRIHAALGRRVVVDARNLYDPARMAALGIFYHSVGRAVRVPAPDGPRPNGGGPPGAARAAVLRAGT